VPAEDQSLCAEGSGSAECTPGRLLLIAQPVLFNNQRVGHGVLPIMCVALSLQATPTVDWVALASILVEKSSSQDEFTRITALKWIKVGL